MLIRKFAILVGFYIPVVAQCQQYSAPIAKLQTKCPDTVPVQGRYLNRSYGFALTIPPPLKGYWNSAKCVLTKEQACVCMSDHGRIIPLAVTPRDPEQHIEVHAGYTVDLDEPTLADEIEKRLDVMQASSRERRVEIRRRTRIRLDGVEAERVVARYYDPAGNRWCIEEWILALRDGVEYALRLKTHDSTYEQDRVPFEAVVKSFRFNRE